MFQKGEARTFSVNSAPNLVAIMYCSRLPLIAWPAHADLYISHLIERSRFFLWPHDYMLVCVKSRNEILTDKLLVGVRAIHITGVQMCDAQLLSPAEPAKVLNWALRRDQRDLGKQ